MPTQILSCGPVWTMTQNTVYALPPVRTLFFTDATTPTVQQSTTVTFTASSNVLLTNGQSEVAGAFIRCTTGDINVTLRS